MDRLSPLDASFIEAEEEDRHTSMAIASIAVFEGPIPTYDEFAAAIEKRLPLVPRYRQRPRTIPLRLGPPVWVDSADFNLRFHIRETAVPPPGGDAELSRLMARVMAQRLDRDRPLWEYWLVDGLAGGRWALISKVHHCMVDGVSGTDLYRVMFDTGEPPPAEVRTGPATREPSSFSLLAQSMADVAMLPARDAGAAARLLSHPAAAARQTADAVRGLFKFAGALPPAKKSSLSGPIGQQRRYLWARVSFDDIRAIRHRLGGTVNDVVLAIITAGFRELLLARGELPTPTTVPSLVPVSMRAPGEENIYDNRVSAMIVHLPVHISDPVERLAAVRQEMASAKASNEVAAGQALTTVGAYLPYPVWSLTRLVFRLPQREIVTVTTNVPGPRQPLYCLGRQLVEILPYVPIASRVRVGVSIFTYNNRMAFGITGDYDANPDLERLVAGIESAAGDLMQAGGGPSPAAIASAGDTVGAGAGATPGSPATKGAAARPPSAGAHAGNGAGAGRARRAARSGS